MVKLVALPALTSLYAGVLGLIFIGLSVMVVVQRNRTGVMHGDGGVDRLNRLIRAHGNFAEYVPFILLLVGLLEMGGTQGRTIHLLLAPLVVARLMHPVGMQMPVKSVAQYAWRATSMTVTWVVLTTAAVMLILRAVA